MKKPESTLLRGDQSDEAAKIIKEGGVVAIPTETVYGLAASVYDEHAIRRIFEIKGRPSDNPLIVHIANMDDIYKVVSEFPPRAQMLADKYWPGPLTMILPKSQKIPSIVSANLPSVAVRFPAHKVAQDIIRKSGIPLVAPSANISGKPSPTKFQHVVNDIFGKANAIVDGGNCEVGLESTVVSLLDDGITILRPGAITFEQLKESFENVKLDKSIYQKLQSNQIVLSPGTKYKHYSPDAEVFIVKGSRNKYIDFVNSKIGKDIYALCYEEDIPFLKLPYISYGKEKNYDEQAYNLFDTLRQFDNIKAKTVYVHFSDIVGIGMAVYNRLVRAAGFKIIEL